MRIKYGPLLGAVGILTFLLQGCASPDQEVIGEPTENTDLASAYEDGDGSVMGDTGSQAQEPVASVVSENHRHISAEYGSGDYMLKIDADVTVPEGDILSGTLKEREPDLSLIEQYLCDGNALHKNEDGTFYISDSNEAGTDLGSDYVLSINNGSASFSNYKLDEYFTGFAIQQVLYSDQNEDQKAFVADMEAKTQTLFDQLNLEGKVSHTWLNDGETNRYCGVFVNAFIGDFPLVSSDYGNFIQSNITIADQGINSANFMGFYEIKAGEAVSVLPLDAVLSIIEQDVENKNINNYENTVDHITLAYMVERGEETSFYPVWCFSGTPSEDEGMMPFLCINAQTGEVALMSGF